ncbi:MAG: chaperone NapD [Alphaproteobacteria bacterium]
MDAPVHISSILVQVRPERLDEIERVISDLGVEIALTDACGKLIAVIETAHESEISRIADEIAVMEGVLSANLVYHAIDDRPDDPPVLETGDTL